jgi:putative RecB family exonuclease
MSDAAELVPESAPAPEGRRRHLALSASRASDYKACPLLYRFRAVDKLPEPPSLEAARGTLVHAVLEDLFGLPAADRTEAAAVDAVGPTWERLSSEIPEWQSMLEPDQVESWLESARDRVRTYFSLEDPTRFSAESRELLLEVEVGDGVPLRGYLDRVDVAPNGALRIVDYKTGRAPGELFEQSALFQMKFYALLVLRTRGVVPHQLKLLYLGDSRWLTYVPSEEELLSFERTLTPLWTAMLLARRTGDFRPRAGKMCGWCAHHALCPEFGGTPPPYPFPDASHDGSASDAGPAVASRAVERDAVTSSPSDRLAGVR